MELNIDRIRNILLDLDEVNDKLNKIPQMYLSPHLENKLEIALEMVTDLEDYLGDRLAELEHNQLSSSDIK